MPWRRLLDAGLIAGAALTVLLALTYTGLRLALPHLAAHDARVETLTSRALGRELRFAALEARMVGFTPRVRLRDVTLAGSDGEPTQLAHLELRVAPLRSLLRRELTIADVAAAGLRLEARRAADGRWWVGGIALGEGGRPELLDWLLDWPQAQLLDAEVRLRDEVHDRALVLHAHRLAVRRHGRTHRLRARLAVSGDVEGRMALTGSVRGLRGALEKAAWRVSGQVEELRTARVEIEGVEWLAPSVDGAAFMRGRGARVDRVAGSLELAAQLGGGDPYRGDVRGVWQRRTEGWVLGLDHARVEQGAARAQAGDALIERAAGRWRVRMAELVLPDDVAVWRIAAAVDGRAADLARVAPGAVVRDLVAVVDGPRRRASARVEQFGWRAQENRIGISGLAGRLGADGTQLSFVPDTEAVVVELPKLYREPLRAEQPEGSATLAQEEGIWTLRAARVRARVRDLPITASLMVRLGEPRTLGLTLALPDLSAAQVSSVLPDAALPDAFSRWYRDAVQDGTAHAPRVLLHGPFGRFFDEGADSRFLVTAEVDGVDLDYWPGHDWPLLQGLRGRVRVDGRTVVAEGRGGTLWDSALGSLRAELADFKAPGAGLRVEGTAEGDAADLLRLLRETDLHARVGTDLPGVSVHGRARTRVELTLGLAKPTTLGVVAVTRLSKGRFSSRQVELTELDGELRLDDRVLSAQGLSGKLLGGPARFDLRAGEGGTARVQGSGRLPAAALSERLDLPAGASGELGWSGALTLAQGAVELDATVDLAAAELPLPAPLGKAAGEPGTMALRARCCAAPGEWRVQADLPAGGAAVLELAEEAGRVRLVRGELGYGVTPALPEQGLRVRAQLERLAADPWLAWAGRLTGGEARAFDLTGMEIHAQVLEAGGREFAEQQVRVTPGEVWELAFDGPQLAGKASVALGTGGIMHFDLARLHWPVLPEGSEGGAPSWLPARLDPRRVPVLSGRVEDLRLDGRTLGSLVLRSARTPGGLAVENLALSSPHGQLSGTGSWEGAGADMRTQFAGTLTATDIGKWLRALGLGDGVRGGSGEIALDASWPGSPTDFTLAQASGSARLKLAHATLPDVEPGLGRLFGVLSLETLQRRLLFDFRDIFGRGFVVDDARGTVHLDAGLARTERLRVRGPAAHLTLRGQIDVADRVLDLDVNVVPQLSSSLPLAAAIGSLGVGAAVFIGQRVLGDAINEMTAQDYRVRGTLDAPEVTRTSEPG